MQIYSFRWGFNWLPHWGEGEKKTPPQNRPFGHKVYLKLIFFFNCRPRRRPWELSQRELVTEGGTGLKSDQEPHCALSDQTPHTNLPNFLLSLAEDIIWGGGSGRFRELTSFPGHLPRHRRYTCCWACPLFSSVSVLLSQGGLSQDLRGREGKVFFLFHCGKASFAPTSKFISILLINECVYFCIVLWTSCNICLLHSLIMSEIKSSTYIHFISALDTWSLLFWKLSFKTIFCHILFKPSMIIYAALKTLFLITVSWFFFL